MAESLGRLYVIYSNEMCGAIDASFKSKNNAERATVVKSFKYGGARDTDPSQLEIAGIDLIGMISDKDLVVKRNALESLNAIVHNQPNVIKGEMEEL